MKIKFIDCLVIFLLSTSLVVYAEDNLTLNFSGNIKAATCNISGGSNIDIDLKQLPINIFNNINTGSEWKMFNIELNNCSNFINQVKLTFTGTADSADIDSLYKNVGTAKNIALQLQSADGRAVLGNQKILQVPINGQSSISIPLRTRAFSAGGNATPGSISSNITATITYL
nr:fimbrial protein [uncultured Moellerella sp.]